MANFTEAQVQQVWEKGNGTNSSNPSEWRQDLCGAWMHRNKYGDFNSIYGWSIDHIKPVSIYGENNELTNLQPLQWENNIAKGDGVLKCAVKSRRVGDRTENYRV